MTPERTPRPPRLVERLLRAVLPRGVVGDSIMGDAREEYAEYVRKGGVVPGLWYWIHGLRLAGGYAIQEGGVGDMGAIFKDLKFGPRALMRMPGATNGQQNPQRSGFGDIPLAVVPRTQGKAGGG